MSDEAPCGLLGNNPAPTLKNTPEGTVITPKPGQPWVPVYGSAFPEAPASPRAVPVQRNARLAYRIRAPNHRLCYVKPGTWW